MLSWVILKETGEYRNREKSKEINQQISGQIGPIAKLKTIRIGFAQNSFREKCILRKEGDYWETSLPYLIQKLLMK
jgi:hypothetical protein